MQAQREKEVAKEELLWAPPTRTRCSEQSPPVCGELLLCAGPPITMIPAAAPAGGRRKWARRRSGRALLAAPLIAAACATFLIAELHRYAGAVSDSSMASARPAVLLPATTGAPRLERRSHLWVTHMPGPNSNSTSTEPETWNPGAVHADDPTHLVWRHEDIARATVAHSHTQFRPLLHKLYTGAPITVFALGSSITQNQGGCFHTGPASQVHAKVGARSAIEWTHHFREDLGDLGACAAPPPHYQGVGWLTAFMQAVNTSFPHADHTLINSGRAGTSLADFNTLGCLEATLPATLDLLVLENALGSGGFESEKLIWRVIDFYSTRQAERPAIVMLVPTRVFEIRQQPESECMALPSLCDTACAHRPFNASLLGPPHYWDEHEAQLVTLANFYGFTLVSHRQFLYSAAQQGVPEREGLTPCKFFAALTGDGLHLAPLGNKLFAHYLLTALASAERFWMAHAPLPTHRLLLPDKELFPNARLLLEARCPVLMDAGGVASPEQGQALLRDGSAVLVQLADDWRFVKQPANPANLQADRRKYKPGVVSSTVGAKLRLVLNTVIGAPRPGAAGSNTTDPSSHAVVTLAYLASYEHMGVASITCVSGCTCEPSGPVNAHLFVEKLSILYAYKLFPSQAQACELQVEILPATSSGEHKWKLVSVVVSEAGHAAVTETFNKRQRRRRGAAAF